MANPILLLLIGFISTGMACEDTPVLYNLAKRARNVAFNYLINDYNINDGWFSTTSENITYTMVTNATLPPHGSCGALYSIYMLGDHPNTTTLPDGQEINVVACLRSYFDVCDIAYGIKIRNCGGDLQYYLLITERYAGYCFGNEDNPPELASVEGVSVAPTNVTLGNIAVTVRLDYVETIVLQGVIENVSPHTVFECEFTQQTGHFYLVEWYANNILFVTLGPTTNVTELLLTDKIITDNGVTLGVNFRCGVSASVDFFGLRTSMNFSDSFFAGIVFNNLTIDVPKTKTGTITFKTTLPIGCEYNKFGPSFCILDLHMFERSYTCGSELQTLFALTDSVQQRCGVLIKVIVTGIAANRNKYCYSHVDPHMMTADSVRYEQQEEGYFLLYRNTNYNIEVQERTVKCNNNRATCTCAVLVRAGADIVMFETCSDRVPFIGYKACGDNGILQTIQVSSNVYRVHTPIGTYVEVRLHTSRVYARLMNVDIHMSPKDFDHTEGLCASYDDDTSNDFTTRLGLVLNNNAHHTFSRTWKLLDNENYFTLDYTQLTAWSEENPIYCICEEDPNAESNTIKTTCSAKPTENCTVTASNDVTKRYCSIVSNRNKRSVSNNLAEQKRRFNLKPVKQSQRRLKRSTVNITESEANTVCADVIGNSLVANNFIDFLAPGEIEAKIEQCIYDVQDSNDLSAAYAQLDAINALVSFEISQDPVYIANNEEQVQAFRQQSCPSNCSAQGTCVNETCQCDTFYHGSSCVIDERDQLAIIDVTGGGVCDLLTSDCTCYSVLTSDLIQAFIFQYSKSQLTVDGNYIFTETVTGSGEYLSIFEGIICLTTPSSTNIFVTHYNISISNDGSTFSQPVEMHVYDSTCQQYILDGNGTSTFSLKTGYCNINGACYAEGDIDMDNNCNICQTSAVNTAWTSVCQNPDDEDATPSLIGIIGGVVGGVVFIGVVAAVVFIVMKAKSKHSNLQTRDENSLDNSGYASLNIERSNTNVRCSASDAACDNSTGLPMAETNPGDHTYDHIDQARLESSQSDIADLFAVSNAAYNNMEPAFNRAISGQPRVGSATSQRSQRDIDVMFTA